jgi:hypothetical protein
MITKLTIETNGKTNSLEFQANLWVHGEDSKAYIATLISKVMDIHMKNALKEVPHIVARPVCIANNEE